jgi:GDP-L-fucose synthase
LDVSIGELAKIIVKVVNYKDRIAFNSSKLDSTPRKLLYVTILETLGWKYRIEPENGVQWTYGGYLENGNSIKK